MNQFLEPLIALVAPPPEGSLPSVNWPSVYRDIEIELPRDYVELINVYGGGRFDSYLWLLEPNCQNRNYDLSRSIDERAEAFSLLWGEGEPKPVQLASEGNRVIPWASTDNGEFFYWFVRPEQSPEEWTVMINEARGESWEHFSVGCVALLTGLLSGQIYSDLLSSSFPLAANKFEPVSEF